MGASLQSLQLGNAVDVLTAFTGQTNLTVGNVHQEQRGLLSGNRKNDDQESPQQTDDCDNGTTGHTGNPARKSERDTNKRTKSDQGSNGETKSLNQPNQAAERSVAGLLADSLQGFCGR